MGRNSSTGAARAVVFFVAGGLVLVVDLVWFGATLVLLKLAATAPGTVVDAPRGHRGFHPVVDFVSDGQVVRTGLSSGFTYTNVGDSVTVLYLADDVYTNSLDTFGALWGPPLALFGLGMASIWAGASTLTRRRLVRP